MVERTLALPGNHSFFLFGARGTGKSTLIRTWLAGLKLPPDQFLKLDLLDPELEHEFAVRPTSLRERVLCRGKKLKWVVLDEVQKVPDLLNVVHALIEENKGLYFALTGSSARKIRRGGANLLAGRAFDFRLYPFSVDELGARFDLHEALEWGTLPALLSLKSDLDRRRFLRAYSHTYLREEIVAEQIVRNVDRFRSFLPVAAQADGTILNFSRISRQSGVDEKSISRFFEILVDTLVGFYLEPYHRSVRKRQYQKPKFYFFDSGVARAMAEQLDANLVAGTSAYGMAFEHFFIVELLRRIDYLEREVRLSFLKTSSGAEVDLIVEKGRGAPLLVEIKSATRLTDDHLKNLELVKPDFPKSRRIVAYCGKERRSLGSGIEALPWMTALKEILA
jgi:predicted AAA+ superfamily ATPase